MTDPTDMTPTRVELPLDLVAALRHELLAESQGDEAEDDILDERWAASLLAAATPDPAIRSAVRSLLIDDSLLLTADRRARLMAAVDSAVEPLSERSLLLPLLLRASRLRNNVTIEDLAASTIIPAENLESLERGDRRVGAQTEEIVAEWIDSTAADHDLALSALERTLEWEQRAAGDMAAGNVTDVASSSAFVEKVRTLLAARSR